MKKLILVISMLLIITACHNSSSKKINADSLKINVTKNDSIIAKQPNPVKEDQTILKFNTFYFDISDPSIFIDIIDSSYCIMLNSLFSYTYDPKYQVIAVSGDIDNPCTNCTQYFKIFSAAYTVSICSGFPDMDMRRLDQLYNLTGSLDNQSFSIIQLGEYSTTTGEYKVYEMNDWLNIYHPLTVGLANQINSFIRNKINQIKNSQDFASTFLIMENKVDLIISKGKENVNAALKDKVDYNYDSLITKWKQINNDKSTLENYINNSSINYTIADLSQSKVFKDLMQNKLLSKQLKTEIAQFNQSLDGEVLPLLQSN